MLSAQRKNEIYELLLAQRQVKVTELSEKYGVTGETIRRDLDKLEKEGLAMKTYGGAVINDGRELPWDQRLTTNVAQKRLIASLVCPMINDGDSLMLDSSSTSLYVLRAIRNLKDLTIITNSVEILAELWSQTQWKVISTGGQLMEGSLSLVGGAAEETLRSFRADKAVISCQSFSDGGFYDPTQDTARIKRAMLECSRTRIVAVDNSKQGRKSLARICGLEAAHHLVTDKAPKNRESFGAIDLIYPKNNVKE